MRTHDEDTPPTGRLPTAADVPAAVFPIVQAVGDGGDLRDALGRAVSLLGFDVFGFSRGRRDSDGRLTTLDSWGSFPAGWDELYRDCSYLDIDPRIQAAVRSAIPEIWDQSTCPDVPSARDFFAALARFGIRSGVIMVLNQPNPSFVEFFSVASATPLIDGERRRAISRTMGDLWAIGAYGHRMLPAATFAEESAGEYVRPLTPREVECLALAARGATSRTIAEQLQISPRTVNAHIERAIKKCKARNRQEAVARCISKGIIPI